LTGSTGRATLTETPRLVSSVFVVLIILLKSLVLEYLNISGFATDMISGARETVLRRSGIEMYLVLMDRS
jgi:hypothetical protein